MTLPASGQISLSTVRTELSATGQLNLGGTSPRTLAGIASGTIGLSNFYSKTFTPTYAFFGGGSGTHATVDKYKYTDSTTSVATSLTNGATQFAAAGNITQGVYGGGINSSYTRVNLTTRYTYAGNTTAFGRGHSGTAYLYSTDVYTHASNTVSGGGTFAATAKDYVGAVGNATYGIWAGGTTNTTVQSGAERYTFASNTIAATVALGTAKRSISGCGNTTEGYFAGGVTATNVYTNMIEIYTFSTGSRTTGTALGVSKASIQAAGNKTKGIFAGGYNGASIYFSEVYTYATNVRTAGSDLYSARHDGAATSSDPGGF